MNGRFSMLFATVVFAVAAGVPSSLFGAFDGVSVSSAPVTFRAYVSDGAVYSLATSKEVAAWPITWRIGEIVLAKAMDGAEYVLSDVGDDSVTAAILPEKGGVWVIANSEGEEARVSVPWSVYQGTGVSLATGVTKNAFVADTRQDGPNRRNKDKMSPPIAYSGDGWAGDPTATSTLTIVPPSKEGGSSTYADLLGSGVQPFSFDKVGNWTVTLAMEDGTKRTAIIGVSGGIVLIVR